jgi:flagellar biosynthesis protein
MPEEPRLERAAALRWDGEGAPRVVASGRGEVARRIAELAREAGVPVRREAALAEALAKLELELEVPEALYAAVAETLAWAYGLDAAVGRGAEGGSVRRPR